jgi:hypothetical protein
MGAQEEQGGADGASLRHPRAGSLAMQTQGGGRCAALPWAGMGRAFSPEERMAATGSGVIAGHGAEAPHL